MIGALTAWYDSRAILRTLATLCMTDLQPINAKHPDNDLTRIEDIARLSLNSYRELLELQYSAADVVHMHLFWTKAVCASINAMARDVLEVDGRSDPERYRIPEEPGHPIRILVSAMDMVSTEAFRHMMTEAPEEIVNDTEHEEVNHG